MSTRHPAFTEEEMVLLLQCYFHYRHKGFSANAPHVIELSNLLRSLPIHPLEVRLDPCFRNKAGIDAQLRTLAACDPENKSKRWKTPSRLMKHYWDIYMHRQDLLERDAEAVLRRCPKSSFYDPVL